MLPVKGKPLTGQAHPLIAVANEGGLASRFGRGFAGFRFRFERGVGFRFDGFFRRRQQRRRLFNHKRPLANNATFFAKCR
jgi:hypothetical protein